MTLATGACAWRSTWETRAVPRDELDEFELTEGAVRDLLASEGFSSFVIANRTFALVDPPAHGPSTKATSCACSRGESTRRHWATWSSSSA
jgi:hypothetical protein